MSQTRSNEDGPGIRHTIGDALYDLVTPYECNDAPDYVVMYPVAKITDRYVWVHGRHRWDKDRLYRFSREDLETTGYAWNRANRLGLRVRPLPDWPVLLVGSRRVDELEAADA